MAFIGGIAHIGASTALTAGTQLTGVRVDPYAAFSFLVEFESLVVGGYSEVSGLEAETEFEEYHEGGQNAFVHKLPTRSKYPANLVLRHGLTDLDFLWAWHQDVIRGRIERKNGTIFLLDRQRVPAMWWNIADAFPVKWTGPQFQAGASEVAVESIELAHHGISKPDESRALSLARGALGAGAGLVGKLGLG